MECKDIIPRTICIIYLKPTISCFSYFILDNKIIVELFFSDLVGKIVVIILFKFLDNLLPFSVGLLSSRECLNSKELTLFGRNLLKGARQVYLLWFCHLSYFIRLNEDNWALK